MESDNEKLSFQELEQLLKEGQVTEFNLYRQKHPGLINLSCIKLFNAGLSGVNLSGVKLEWADFRGADLKNANLSNTNITGADFRGANTAGVNFSQTIKTTIRDK